MEGDFEWFQEQNVTPFIGKWVVVVNKRVYGSGEDLGPILEKLRKEVPDAVPFIEKVRDPSYFHV